MLEVIKKISALLSPRERRQMYWLFLAILVSAFMEVVGVASIMPFMGVLSNPDAIENHRYLSQLYGALNFTNTHSFLIFLGVAVLAALLLSNLFAAITTWAILRITFMRNYTISKRLLIDYVSRPYLFFVNRNSSDLSKNILSEVLNFVMGVLMPGVQMLAKAIVALFLIALLFVADPLISLIMSFIVGGAYACIYIVVRRRLVKLGKLRVIANQQLFQSTAEVFGGIKDIKLLGREKTFIDRFSKASRRYSNYLAVSRVISQLPRYALEAIIFGGVLFVVLYLLIARGGIGGALPVLALYLLASYRLMPALQQVFSFLTKIKFSLPVVDVLYNDFVAVERSKNEITDDISDSSELEVPFNHEIRLHNISFTYPDSDSLALKDVSLCVPRNRTVAFVGMTGSGKTTLVDIILGFLTPEKGCMTIDGEKIHSSNVKVWQKKMGYVPQVIYLSDDSIEQNIAFGISKDKVDVERVERAAKTANIHEFICGLQHGYKTVVGERGIRLSGGQRQRIGIARALYNDPEVLVMDEATSALDGMTEDTVMQAIANLSHRKTIIQIAHRLTTVQEADMIYMIESGEMVAKGNYAELMSSNVRFREMAKINNSSLNF